MAPRPILADIAPPPPPEPVAVVEPEPQPEPKAVVAPEAQPTAVPEPDHALIARVADLESRLEEQDAALRRVLTLLVDWVEMGERPDLASLNG
jgi:hypothetical protein